MNILVTNSSGRYSRLALNFLQQLAPEANLFCLIQDEKDAVSLEARGINVRVADYFNKASLIRGLKDIDRVLLVSLPTPGIQQNFIEAANMAGVKFIAYTSLAGLKFDRMGFQVDHQATEDMISASKIDHTYLRNGWYLENCQPYLKTAVKTGKFWYVADQGTVSFALRREFAEAGARLILQEQPKRHITLTRWAYSYPEIGQALALACQKDLEIKAVDADTFITYLTQAGVPSKHAYKELTFQQYVKAGHNGEELSDQRVLEDVLGRKLEPFAEIVKEVIRN